MLCFSNIHRLHKSITEKLPRGLYPIQVPADGNCFFSSISMALFGDITYSAALRLAAVCHAADHYNHYLEMVSYLLQIIIECPLYKLSLYFQYQSAVKDVGEAQQLLGTVVSSNRAYESRPTDHPTVIDLLHYMLRECTRDTAVLGRYSGQSSIIIMSDFHSHFFITIIWLFIIGLLQIQFTAGATGHPIRQFANMAEVQNQQLPTIYPCACMDHCMTSSQLFVLWECHNHILPLIPVGG